MALQDPDILSMVALSTLHDSPPNPLQPKLVDAIHLRWAFRPDLGFPWHGFFLFRRFSKTGRGHCIGPRTGGLKPGPMNTNVWASGIGHVHSDAPLVLRDDFPQPGLLEFDLSGRQFLEFLPLEPARSVELRIGFRGDEQKRPQCLDFAELFPQALPNPYEQMDIFLQTFDREGQPNPSNEIAPVTVGGEEHSALLLPTRTLLKTLVPVDAIELKLVGPEKVTLQAFDASGNTVEPLQLSAPGAQVQHYRLEGSALQEVFITLEGVAYLLSLCLEGGELRPFGQIRVSAFAHNAEVTRAFVTGLAGEVVTVSLSTDFIDRVRVAGGSASLVDLCWIPIFQDAQAGWEPLKGIEQPITLPVRHPDYPASGGLPVDLDASRAKALDRVKYGDPSIWKEPFEEIHEQCLNLVVGGPAVPMASPDRAVTYPVELEPGDTAEPPALPRQHPLQLLLLAGMHAPIAQILGLCWSDTTAVEGETYDYLIVADHKGRGERQASMVKSLIETEGFVDLDGYIVFGKRLEPAAPLPPPVNVTAYALPGTTRPDFAGSLDDASCNAGFRWQLPVVNDVLLPASPVLYHLWWVDYGPSEPGAPAGPESFTPLTPEDPLLVVESMFSLYGVQRPQDWPPFPLFGFDNALSEGWYGYRVSSIDIFGQHSALGQAARWFQWAPAPQPRPWYYQDPPGDTLVHPYAIGLLDKLPPPPPTGVEAFALDPQDPFLLRDAAYNAWFASLSDEEKAALIGLRVSWFWAEAQMQQAPDTHEFRIYYQGGRLNTLLGQIQAVTAAGATESLVQTDIPNNRAAGAFSGCYLKVGPKLFTITGSEAGSPLRLRVKNIGPLDDEAPQERVNCEVNIPNNHALFIDYRQAHPWEERFYVVGFDEHVTLGVDEAGRPLRRYEVLLPASGDTFRGGLPLQPNLAEPIQFAAIGVTAADHRAHTADDPKWAAGRFGGRTGNESPVSPPAIVFRVLREKPEPPVPPPDSERVFASPADYHAASFYTFRWSPQAHLKTHVYRAMDETVFIVDWSSQPRAEISPDDLSIFPSETAEPRWNSAKRQQVAGELNMLNTFPKTVEGKEQALKYYRGLSNDGLRVLANLPGNEAAFAQVTVAALDPNDPSTANRVGPDNPSDFVVDPALRLYVDTLDGRSNNRYFYRACYVDGAQNRSALSLSGPPIWLPNDLPPSPPAFTKVLAGDADPANPGDNKITLRWASNREEDLAEYRIYRAMNEIEARSIRSMTRVHTVPAPAGEPEERPVENTWTDTGVPALQWIYYRMTAVDTAGNESPPNEAVKARAFDESLPEVPALQVAWVPTPANLARAAWTAATETRLERRAATELIWETLTEWLPPGSHSVDDNLDEHFPWKFRLRARKPTGALSVGQAVNLFRK